LDTKVYLTSETRKHLLNAAEANNAGKIVQLLFDSLSQVPNEPPVTSTDLFSIESLEPSLLEFERDEFNTIDVVTVHLLKWSILEASELNPDYVLEEIVKTVAKKGSPDSALKISKYIKEGWERRKAHEAVIFGYLNAGALDKAFNNRHLVERPSTRLNLLCYLADAYLSAGNREACKTAIDEAVRLANTERTFDRDKCLGRISVVQAKLGEFNSAYSTIETIDDVGVCAIAWSRISIVLAKHGRSLESEQAFIKAFQETEKIRCSPVRFKCLLLVLEGQAEIGNYEKAISTAKGIECDLDRVAYVDRILADGFSQDFLGKACVMESYNLEFQELTTRDQGLCSIVGFQALSGDINGALNTLKLIRWSPLQAKAFSLIGKCCADLSDFVSAREYFVSASKILVENPSRNQSRCLYDLALEQAKVRDFDSALSSIRLFNEICLRVFPLTLVGELQGSCEGWEASREVFNEAIEAVADINDGTLKADALLKIGLCQAKVGAKEDSKKTFGIAIDTAANISPLFWKVDSLLSIAFAQTETGQWEQACLTFENVRNLAELSKDSELIRKVAVRLAEKGFCDDAVDVSRLLTAYPNDWPWVASVLVKKGDLANFRQLLLQGSYDWVTVGKMCVLLAEAYPDQAEKIAELIVDYMKDGTEEEKKGWTPSPNDDVPF
jgi:tetratricopeptide (TPR) repeat protein